MENIKAHINQTIEWKKIEDKLNILAGLKDKFRESNPAILIVLENVQKALIWHLEAKSLMDLIVNGINNSDAEEVLANELSTKWTNANFIEILYSMDWNSKWACVIATALSEKWSADEIVQCLEHTIGDKAELILTKKLFQIWSPEKLVNWLEHTDENTHIAMLIANRIIEIWNDENLIKALGIKWISCKEAEACAIKLVSNWVVDNIVRWLLESDYDSTQAKILALKLKEIWKAKHFILILHNNQEKTFCDSFFGIALSEVWIASELLEWLRAISARDAIAVIWITKKLVQIWTITDLRDWLKSVDSNSNWYKILINWIAVLEISESLNNQIAETSEW